MIWAPKYLIWMSPSKLVIFSIVSLITFAQIELGAPGPYISNLGTQILDLEQLFIASPFLICFLLLHWLKQTWEVHVHISALWVHKHLTWMGPSKLVHSFYGFSYYICSDRAGEIQVHISAFWLPKYLIQMSLSKLVGFFFGASYYICSGRAYEFQDHIPVIWDPNI